MEYYQLIDLVGLVENAIKLASPVKIETKVGDYIYTPGRNDLFKVPDSKAPRLATPTHVSTIESLVTIALNECDRMKNMDGSNMMVIFENKGALLIPDIQEGSKDTVTPYPIWQFNRCNSQQWGFLTEKLDISHSHKELMSVIQGLKPSILEYKAIFNALRKATITDTAQLVSSPIIEEGIMGESLNWNLNIEGAGSARIPTGFSVSMPFTRNSEKSYTFEVEIGIQRVKKENHFTAAFCLSCPERELVKDAAIQDELKYFTEATKSHPKILKLVNYTN